MGGFKTLKKFKKQQKKENLRKSNWLGYFQLALQVALQHCQFKLYAVCQLAKDLNNLCWG